MKPAPDVSSRLRELIRKEATRLFACRGFSGTSIREVAEACKCTKPALYYYFTSKEALFRDVVSHHLGSFDRLIQSVLEEQGPVRDRLRRITDLTIDHCIEQPFAIQLLQRIETSPEEVAPDIDTAAAQCAHMQMFSELLAQGVESGELRADIEPDDGALLFTGGMRFLFELSISSDHWDRARFHRLINLLLDGMAA